MPSLFDIGKSGLQAYRQSLAVTGQNIANVNTEGYKKRDTALAEVSGAGGGVTEKSDQTGLGVRVDEIRRSFDEFLIDKKNPLSMPPDYGKLPEPGEANLKSSDDIISDETNIKNLLKNIDNQKISSTDESTSIESFILKKIK